MRCGLMKWERNSTHRSARHHPGLGRLPFVNDQEENKGFSKLIKSDPRTGSVEDPN